MSGIHGLSWFPNFPKKFVTWGGSDIKLNEICQRDENGVKTNHITFCASETRYQYARCVQPSYHQEQPIVALGMGDGKVVICNFQETVDSGWEYTPRQQRSCLCLAWNEMDPNICAIGHDRHRSDTCITIWDIERGVPKENASFLGLSESAHSLCWDRSSHLLIAGMNQKQIKLFDLRQNNTNSPTVTTKSVHGLSIAPNGNYLCSFVDSVITLWDFRVLDRSLKIIQSSKNHFQVSWCPTRSSLLASLQRESPFLTLYDVRCVDVENTREVYTVKKQLLPFHTKHHSSHKGRLLTALSWHPSDFERALLLSETGQISDFRLPLAMLTAYSNHRKLPVLFQRPLSAPGSPTMRANKTNDSFDFASLGSSLNVEVLDHDLLAEDLVDEIRQRALNNYGVKSDYRRLADLQLSAYLKNVWLTLCNLYRDHRLTGIKTLLGIDVHTSEALSASSRVESHVLQWPDYMHNSNHLIYYRSEQRDRALKLCGWTFDQDLERFTNTLCDQKEFSRAAMICVFHLKVLAACDILSKAAEQSRDATTFRIAAIALSSFNADRCSSAWRNQRSNANMQIQDAHLRAIFSFLTIENENYDVVLNEEGISLSDRMAFACKYLSENKLAEYATQQIKKCTEEGDLNGLLLTGESVEGINLLQAYVDATFDVQTVALIAINYFQHEQFADNRIEFWISYYFDILNSWGFWEQRAELNIKIGHLRSNTRQNNSVFLSCNFCGKSVSTAHQEDTRLRNASANVNKLSSCPNCRKPLPRCSLCLLHMGTTVSPSSSGGNDSTLNLPPKPFSKWYSWCQTCRHGGHTEHLLQWFKQNSECPVSSCSCRCFDLDGAIPNNAYLSG